MEGQPPTTEQPRTMERQPREKSSTQKIIPHLWFDDQAEKAADFYTRLFDDSRLVNVTHYTEAGREAHGREPGSAMTVDFELAGQQFTALNGGPYFNFNPSISFSVVCETESELDALWTSLLDGGMALMELGTYDWSEKYGWVQDRYGLSWQLSLGDLEEVGQKITPSLMFVTDEGQAEDAINLYTSLFDDSDVVGIHRYGSEDELPEGLVMHAQFRLNGETFMAMDGGSIHDFTFNEAVSLVVNCRDQDEIDYFWSGLSEGGDEKAKQCGWLKDRFGVSWQVVPVDVMNEVLLGGDEEGVTRATNAMMQMKKLDIAELKAAYKGRAAVT